MEFLVILETELLFTEVKWKTDDDMNNDPRMDMFATNYGNIWTPDKPNTVKTQTILYPDDILEYTITAKDPQGGKLIYAIHPTWFWQKSNLISIKIDEKDIGKETHFQANH